MSQLCPCGSQKEYTTCCEPYLLEKETPSTAEALMRSRYTAHVMVNTDYIINTTHSSTRKNHSAKEIEKWAKNSQWQKLEIISKTWGGVQQDKGEVEFKAHYLDAKNVKYTHHELSYFAKEADNKWYYITGKINPLPSDLNKVEKSIKPLNENVKIGRNDPCSCGSGKKYKKCCG